MSDPNDRLGPLARAIVDEGHDFGEPSERDRARVRGRLAAALGVSSLTAAGTQAAAASSGAAEATAASGAASGVTEATAASGAAAGTVEAAAGTIAAAKLSAATSGTGVFGVLTALGGKGLISLIGVAALGAAVTLTVVLRQPPATSWDKPATAAPSPASGDRRPPAAAAPQTARPAVVDQAPQAAIATREAHTEPEASAVPTVRAGTQAQPRAVTRSSAAISKAATREPRSSTARIGTPEPQRPVLVPATPEPSTTAVERPLTEAAEPVLEQNEATAAVAPASGHSDAAPAAAMPPPAATVTNQPLPPTTRKPEPPPVAKAPALAGELKLLAAAQEAIRMRALSRALDLLDEHAARFPRGALRPERLAARAVVLCRMSETNAGRAALHRLEAETSESPLLAWAREACGM